MLNIRTLFHKKETGKTDQTLWVWVSTVCLGLFGKQLMFEIIEHLPYLLLFFTNKMSFFFTLFHKKQTGKTLIRLLLFLQKQSDLGQHCLSRPFCEVLEHLPYLFLFSKSKMVVTRTLFHKTQTKKTLNRLLLQKHSHLGQDCLSRPFWQSTDV